MVGRGVEPRSVCRSISNGTNNHLTCLTKRFNQANYRVYKYMRGVACYDPQEEERSAIENAEKQQWLTRAVRKGRGKAETSLLEDQSRLRSNILARVTSCVQERTVC